MKYVHHRFEIKGYCSIDYCELNGSLHLCIFVLGIIFREEDWGIADTLLDPTWITMPEKAEKRMHKRS